MMKPSAVWRTVVLACWCVLCLGGVVDAGAQGRPDRTLMILYTNNTNGWLDPCG